MQNLFSETHYSHNLITRLVFSLNILISELVLSIIKQVFCNLISVSISICCKKHPFSTFLKTFSNIASERFKIASVKYVFSKYDEIFATSTSTRQWNMVPRIMEKGSGAVFKWKQAVKDINTIWNKWIIPQST